MGFTIKELETLSGIKAHTIRIWEQRYSFLKPSRTATNIRTYSNEELKTLLTVALLNKQGYKISRIDTMGQDQRHREVMALSNAGARQEALVNELIGYMIDLDIAGFERVLDRHIRQSGLDHTITALIFSFLDKIGLLWQTGRINPAHEHIVSNLIRQKIIAAIDALPPPHRKELETVLLLPEGEFHELGLLYVCYLLRQRGAPVIYIGANVPLKDAQYILQVKRPQRVYIHLTRVPARAVFQKYISGLATIQPGVTILLSGQAVEALKPASQENRIVLQSLAAVTAYISAL